jgi:hypothetical protein
MCDAYQENCFSIASVCSTKTAFFGFEDIDFCLRARAARFRATAAGNASIDHEGQGIDRVWFPTPNPFCRAQPSVGRPVFWACIGYVALAAYRLHSCSESLARSVFF